MRRVLQTMWCVKEEGDEQGDKKENNVEKIEVGEVEMTEQNDARRDDCGRQCGEGWMLR